jgi:hypothetical protein
MKTLQLTAVVIALAGCAHPEPEPVPVPVPVAVPVPVPAPDVPVVLSGDVETPPVQTDATGHATIVVGDDGTIGGRVEAPGIADATANIEDDSDSPGTVVVVLVPVGDGSWEVPAGTKLTPSQVQHHKSGKVYANVRSKAHPKGEVRAQLRSQSDEKAKDNTTTPSK